MKIKRAKEMMFSYVLKTRMRVKIIHEAYHNL